MPQPDRIGKMMDAEEAAALFGVSVATVRRWTRLHDGRRKLPHYRVGKRILISEEQAASLLRVSERPSAA